MIPITQISNPNKELFVYWMLTDWCNQQCSYCPKNIHEGDYHLGRKKGFPSEESLLLFCDRILELAGNRQLRVTLTGGEPTIHPSFGSVLSRLGSVARVEVITNGTRSSSWWAELPQLPRRVIISLHPQYYDRRVERINDLTAWFISQGVAVVYNLLCDPDQWSTVERMHQDLDPKYRPWVIPKVLQDLSDPSQRPRANYTLEQLAWIQQYPTRVASIYPEHTQLVLEDGTRSKFDPHQLIAQGQHHFQGWQCSAGLSSITVDYTGGIFAGICQSQRLGSIRDFELNTTYMTCPKRECSCAGDVILDKHHPNYAR